jgi:hypothetical protein
MIHSDLPGKDTSDCNYTGIQETEFRIQNAGNSERISTFFRAAESGTEKKYTAPDFMCFRTEMTKPVSLYLRFIVWLDQFRKRKCLVRHLNSHASHYPLL